MTDLDRSGPHGFEYVQHDDNVHFPEASLTTEVDAPKHEGSLKRLLEFASTSGDLTHLFTADQLSSLGARCVDDWRRDDGTREKWKTVVKDALDIAASERVYEGSRALGEEGSDISYPILSTAARAFADRSYPAIVKGDEAVGIHLPPPPPQPQPVPSPPPEAQGDPQAQQLFQQAQAAAKLLADAGQAHVQLNARASRVKTWMNYRLFYGMDGFEADVDALLNQVPIVGKAFMKVSYAEGDGVICELVPALRVTYAMDTRNIQTCPRITQDFDLYPYEAEEKMRAGVYRELVLPKKGEDDEAPRMFLEQHRMEDMDGDGLPEPWIVTLDEDTKQVVRLEAAFGPTDVVVDHEKAIRIKRWNPWADFDFLPDPKGRAYAMGLGKLLNDLGDVVDTMINQLVDAGTAQIAGGGFIASGLRLQGAGQSSTLRWRLGEYKVVNAGAADLKNGIWERPLPAPSEVSFKLLDMMLSAAKDVGSVKDVLTGDTPATAPVGTTMAVADQALQPFNAVYKRVYRGLTRLFALIYECEARWGQVSDEDYARITGDPTGKFKGDFVEGGGRDIRPVSDPQTVTRQQRLAKAQGVIGLASSPVGEKSGMDMRKVASVALEAMDEDPSGYFAPPAQPDPLDQAHKQAEVARVQSEATLNRARSVQALGTHTAELAGIEEGHAESARADNREARNDATAAHGIFESLRQPGGDGGVAPGAGDEMGSGGV